MLMKDWLRKRRSLFLLDGINEITRGDYDRFQGSWQVLNFPILAVITSRLGEEPSIPFDVILTVQELDEVGIKRFIHVYLLQKGVKVVDVEQEFISSLTRDCFQGGGLGVILIGSE